MTAQCADHVVAATWFCVDCGRGLCDQCPVQDGLMRCQGCVIAAMGDPKPESFRPAGGVALKVLVFAVALALACAGGCQACSNWLSDHVHT